MARSRLFHAIVVVGTTLGASGPLAVGSAGCQLLYGQDEPGGSKRRDLGVGDPDLFFWAHVEARQFDLSGWGTIDIQFPPFPDFSTVDQSDGGADLAQPADGDLDAGDDVDAGSDGEG